jgi:hypothetical protein
MLSSVQKPIGDSKAENEIPIDIRIWDAGFAGDIDAITSLVKQRAFASIAVKAAVQGEQRIVLDYLLGRYPKFIRDAVAQAALEGRFGLVEYLMPKKPDLINAAIISAVQGNHRNWLNDLMKKDPSTIFKVQRAAGKVDNLKYAQYLIRQGGDAAAKEIAITAARYGEANKTLMYLVHRHKAALPMAIYGAASVYDTNLVKRLMMMKGSLDMARGGALEKKDLKMAKLLIDLDRASLFGTTEYWGYAYAGNLSCISIVGLLIDEGASPTRIVKIAADDGDADMVKYLVNERGADRDVAIKYAARAGHTLLQQYLQDTRGAGSTEAENTRIAESYSSLKRKTLLVDSARDGNLDVVKRLVEHEDTEFCSQTLNEVVLNAAAEGHFAVIEYLVNKGVSVAHALRSLIECKQFASEDYAIRSLASVSVSLRAKFIKEAEGNADILFDLSSLLSQVNALMKSMHDDRISLNQAFAWRVPEVREILTFCLFSGELPRDIYFLIATFFFPVGGSQEDASKLLAHVNRASVSTVSASTTIVEQHSEEAKSSEFKWEPKKGFACASPFENAQNRQITAVEVQGQDNPELKTPRRSHYSSSIFHPAEPEEGRGMRRVKRKVHRGVLAVEEREQLLQGPKKGGEPRAKGLR